MKVSILGAGKLGTALARLSVAAGHETLIYARPKPLLDIILSSLVPEAQLVDFESALKADIVIVALPRTALPNFDFSAAHGLVVDATNPWESAGTAGTEFELPGVQVPVVRTLNHIAYDDLTSDSRVLNPHALPRAVAVIDAGQGDKALETACELVSSLGFDVVLMPESAAHLFEPDSPAFGAFLTKEQMEELRSK
ncbi:NADPH-dependent F420 reductase [Rothia sp. L_38]|uniref:NADPH-dependent F420 reductase n=1 Tax=Rothia sp. L_38 TaxID=3422315 RepID=UPI003D6BD019